jgi:aspartyl-tRNA(Asn)/glutamyl-tRNA(Gln) amidotransferase subunit B
MDELQKHLDAAPSSHQPTPENFAEFLTYILERKVNSTAAQTLLRRMVETGGDPAQILADGDLSQVSDATSIASIVDQIIAENPDAVADLKAGKQNAMKFLVGAAMKASKGKADPEAVQELLVERLGST